MSYILEALKKAQAERQLGSAPTIHAPAAAAVPESNAARKPIILGAVAGVLIVGAGMFMWHRQPAPVQVAAVSPAPKPAPTRAPAVLEQAAPAPHVALVGQADPPPKPAEPPARSRIVPEPVAAAPGPVAPAAAKPVAARPAPVQVASVAAAPAPAAAAPAPADDNVRGLNELPEAVRSGLPKVAFGGYMYSPNPADRLVLVDNILRREGEEVAPGLVLEKLLPKGAVMNYRGYRYRVPF
jgi:general secretion pathway protein B